MNKNIEYIKKLLNQQIIKEIIFDSELKNYINTKKFSENKIDEFFVDCIEILETKPKLIKRFIDESSKFDITKYHKENLITHLYCVGWICSLFADKFELNPEFAFKLGFFHDIGKPWAKKIIQTKKKTISNSKGHAQVGENICQELGLDKKISWCTSNHMCSCCHENNTMLHWKYTNSVQLISFNKYIIQQNKKELIEYANSLACLMLADDLGRLGEINKNYLNVINHSENWLNWFKQQITQEHNIIKYSVNNLTSLHPDNSIIIQMYGHSGFGKTTAVKEITEILDKNNISWECAERDKSYYNIYSKVNKLNINEIINTINYSEVYNFIQTNDLKKDVQTDWINQLNSILDSNSKVKIIDSVQLMYPSAWESTLNSLNYDAQSVHKLSLKIGYYGFPQSEYGRDYIPKTGTYQLIPREKNDAFTWPNINSELDKDHPFNQNLIDVAYGTIEPIINSIINYINWSQLYIPLEQIHLIDILNNNNIISNSDKKKNLTSKYIQEFIENKFPPGIIQTNEEYNYLSSYIIRFGYKDGMQIFNGISRDYRGETLLFDATKFEYYIGRVSLPVFSDYADLRKDPMVQNIIENNICSEYHIIPKFDGSLFVLALIKINTPGYTIISKILHLIDSKSYYSNELGIWCLGSKGCMFAKNQFGNRGVLSRIYESIEASYTNISNFIKIVSDEIKSNGFIDIYENISLCFEAISSKPTDELTVDYSKAFCPFLCWIVWDGNKKNIILPNNILYLNPIAEIKTVDTWDKVIEFKNIAHSRLLQGSQLEEPEGFVVWFGDTNLGVKLKHQEYYAAHKPYTKKNIEMSKRIEFDEEYSKLKSRLIKFKPKPPIINLIGKNLEFISDLFIDNYKYLNSKKNWAIRWKQNNLLKELDEILEIIENNICEFYPQFKNSIKGKGFQIAMDYFCHRDNWKKYFLNKYLKI